MRAGQSPAWRVSERWVRIQPDPVNSFLFLGLSFLVCKMAGLAEMALHKVWGKMKRGSGCKGAAHLLFPLLATLFTICLFQHVPARPAPSHLQDLRCASPPRASVPDPSVGGTPLAPAAAPSTTRLFLRGQAPSFPRR